MEDHVIWLKAPQQLKSGCYDVYQWLNQFIIALIANVLFFFLWKYFFIEISPTKNSNVTLKFKVICTVSSQNKKFYFFIFRMDELNSLFQFIVLCLYSCKNALETFNSLHSSFLNLWCILTLSHFSWKMTLFLGGCFFVRAVSLHNQVFVWLFV